MCSFNAASAPAGVGGHRGDRCMSRHDAGYRLEQAADFLGIASHAVDARDVDAAHFFEVVPVGLQCLGLIQSKCDVTRPAPYRHELGQVPVALVRWTGCGGRLRPGAPRPRFGR